MEKIQAKDFIKDYVQVGKITNDNLQSIVEDISAVLKDNEQFIEGANMSSEKIADVLKEEMSKATSEEQVQMNSLIDEIKRGNDDRKDDADSIKSEITESTNSITNGLSGINFGVMKMSNTVDSIKSITGNVLSGVLGDMQKYVDFGRDLVGSFVSDIKEMSSNEKLLKVNDESLDVLKDIRDLYKQSYLADERFRNRHQDTEGMSLSKMIIAGGLSALVGGYVRTIILPFELMSKASSKLMKALKIKEGSVFVFNKIFDSIFITFDRIFKHIKIFSSNIKNVDGSLTKIIKKVSTLFVDIRKSIVTSIEIIRTSVKSKILKYTKYITEAVTKIVPIKKISTFIKNIKDVFLLITSRFSVIGGMLDSVIQPLKFMTKALFVGFEKLFIPLQLILSTIEFVKGFINSKEESIIGKFKDGIVQVLMDFMELPVKMLGWLFDKVFGTDNSSEKMLKKIREALDSFFSLIMMPVENLVSFVKFFGNIVTLNFDDAFGNLSDIVKNTYDKIIGIGKFMYSLIPDSVIKMIKKSFDYINDKLIGIGKFIYSLIPDDIKSNIEGIINPIIDFFKYIGDVILNVIEYAKKKIESIPLIGSMLSEETNTEKLKSLLDKQLEIKRDINEQERNIKEGDYRTALGFSRKKILKERQEEYEKLTKEISELRKLMSEEAKKEAKKEARKSPKIIKNINTIVIPSRVSSTKNINLSSNNVNNIGTTKLNTYSFIDKNKKKETNIQKNISESIAYDIGALTPKSKALGENIKPVNEDRGLADSTRSVIRLKANIKKREMEANKNVLLAVKDRSKQDIEKQSKGTQPIIINNNAASVEPPEDIEAMSILWLNKSYGLG